MARGRMAYGVVASVLAASLLVPSTSLAATMIVENRGVGGARLGQRDAKAARGIGRVVRKKRDNSYENQVVWVYYFGRRVGRAYAVQMYSNKRHIVFAFVINGSGYRTRKGIGVGSTESRLQSAYGSALRTYPGPVYTRYALGGRPGTDFYVKSGRVVRIMIRSY